MTEISVPGVRPLVMSTLIASSMEVAGAAMKASAGPASERYPDSAARIERKSRGTSRDSSASPSADARSSSAWAKRRVKPMGVMCSESGLMTRACRCPASWSL